MGKSTSPVCKGHFSKSWFIITSHLRERKKSFSFNYKIYLEDRGEEEGTEGTETEEMAEG